VQGQIFHQPAAVGRPEECWLSRRFGVFANGDFDFIGADKEHAPASVKTSYHIALAVKVAGLDQRRVCPRATKCLKRRYFMDPILNGLIAAPYTPFSADGSLNLELIAQQAASLHRNGITGAFVCGTTGEGVSLTAAERFSVVARWQAVRPSGLKLIVHVGHASLAESEAFASHAAKIGADAIAAIAPSFFKPASLEDLVAVCARIAAMAPGLPFYYYHMPVMTGVNFPMALFLEAAEKQIPTLAGIKFTHEDLMDYVRAAGACGGKYDLLFGRDEILLAGLALGAKGAVGSTYNFAAPLYHQIMKSFTAGDLPMAQALQRRAISMISLLQRYGGLAAGKAIMKFIGLDCGPVRLPMRTITAEAERRLRADLEVIGFFEFSNR
jgi:N-acetylneuraminate lyase